MKGRPAFRQREDAPTRVRWHKSGVHGAAATLEAAQRPTIWFVSVFEANPYCIALSPGDVAIAHGSDLLVTAVLQAFSAVEATL